MFSHLSLDAFAMTLHQQSCKDIAARCENSAIKWLSMCVGNSLVFFWGVILYEVYHLAVIAETVSGGIFIQEPVWPLFALCSRCFAPLMSLHRCSNVPAISC